MRSMIGPYFSISAANIYSAERDTMQQPLFDCTLEYIKKWEQNSLLRQSSTPAGDALWAAEERRAESVVLLKSITLKAESPPTSLWSAASSKKKATHGFSIVSFSKQSFAEVFFNPFNEGKLRNRGQEYQNCYIVIEKVLKSYWRIPLTTEGPAS